MKIGELLWLSIRWSLLLIICALFAAPLLDKSNNGWNSRAPKQVEKETPKATNNTVPKKPQPIYRTFGVSKLKEVYTYKKHGFYVYEYKKNDTPVDLKTFESMTKNLKYNNENYLNIYIFDKKIDDTLFWNAPKELPANLIIEAEKQKPFVKLISLKDNSDNLCIYKDNRVIYYFRSFATNWNWTQPKDDNGNCSLF